ncbi:hypothetical protein ACROAH_15245 [Shewanella oncorhynchi]|uniref:hypothetical protein n=1 Tax=Shewanella oncorhynchi TaxID=2726434 RepID=UPI003D78DE77
MMNLQLKALKAIYDKKPHLVVKYISAGLTGNLLNYRDGILLRSSITSNQPVIAKALLDAGADGFVLRGEVFAAAFKQNNPALIEIMRNWAVRNPSELNNIHGLSRKLGVVSVETRV